MDPTTPAGSDGSGGSAGYGGLGGSRRADGGGGSATPARRRGATAPGRPPGPGEARALLPALAALPGHLLWRASARVTHALAAAPAGLDLHAHAALLALADGATASQQDLARTIAVSRTTMVKVGADLARAGLVRRVRNPEDRRSYALTRTPAGDEAARLGEQDVAALEQAVTGALPTAEAEELRSLLLTVCRPDLDPQTPAALLASTGFLVVRAQQQVHRDAVAALAPLDLEPRLVGSLTALAALGPVPQAGLARSLGVSGATVVQIVDDLEARAMVERRRSDSDRRTHLLHLLPAAPAALAAAGPVVGDAVEARLAGLGRPGRDRLVALLSAFVTAA